MTRSQDQVCLWNKAKKNSLVGKLLVVKRDATLLKKVQSAGRNFSREYQEEIWSAPNQGFMNLYLKNKKMTHLPTPVEALRNKT